MPAPAVTLSYDIAVGTLRMLAEPLSKKRAVVEAAARLVASDRDKQGVK